MARKRIIAHYMNQGERSVAERVMPGAESTDSYLIGEIDESAVDGLAAEGLIIEEMPDDPLVPLADLSPALRTASTNFLSEFVPPEFDPTRANFFTILLAGPLLEPWREQLDEAGVEIIEAIGPQLYSTLLETEQLTRVRDLPFVVSLHLQVPSERVPPIPETRSGPPVDTGVDQILTYDIRLLKAEDAPRVVERLARPEAIVAGVQGCKIRIAIKADSPLLASLRAMPEVYQVYEYVPPELSNDRARSLLGVDAPGTSNPVTCNIPFDGHGQIIGIADTGIDDKHPDFQGRLVGISALGRTYDHSDPHGHGTHVAGSVGGDGTASKGEIRGVAPAASIFFQSIMDARGKLGGLPWDLNNLFDEAYQAGARIHNNSWGADTASRYTFNSIEADEFVGSHRDMTIVIAAGNEGTARQPFNTKPGFVDWLSIGSPATSKNAVTVGASQTDRTSGGISHLTWGQAWPDDFPDAPISTEKTSGDPESMAAFSSRGPCDDRRIKPDVVAPGTNIVSTKSSRAPMPGEFWGPFPDYNSRYAYMGGTSMAAPIVTGCLALIRQYYVDERLIEPSAALLKATLINSTRRLTGSSAVADFPALPNFHQGFGCVHMPWAIPNLGEPALRLDFRDTWKDAKQQFTATGQRLQYVITARDARPLRFCLAYTDIPGRALQNQLNLFVQSMTTGQKWVGNQDLPMGLLRVDPDNNVEIVRIDEPQGDYLIQITATNLLNTKGQDFALVVTGDLGSSISVFV
jgi:serine protease AprX